MGWWITILFNWFCSLKPSLTFFFSDFFLESRKQWLWTVCASRLLFEISSRCLACRWSPLSPSWWRVALTSVHSPPISNRNCTSLTLLSSRRPALNCRQFHPKGAIFHRQVPQPLLWYSWGIGLNFAQNLCRSLPSHVIEIKSIALYYQYGFSDIE